MPLYLEHQLYDSGLVVQHYLLLDWFKSYATLHCHSLKMRKHFCFDTKKKVEETQGALRSVADAK